MNELVEFGKYKDMFPKKEISTNVAVIREDQKNILAISYNNYWATPKFKLKWFIGQAEYTPFHKIRQYLLELRAREDSLESQEYELAKIKVQLEIAERDYQEETDELKKKLIAVEVARMKNGVQSTSVRTRDLYMERQHFLDLIDDFNNSPEGKDAEGNRYIDMMGTDLEEKHEKDYWTVRLARQAAMDLCAYGRIGAGNLEAIMQLSADQQNEALKLAHTVQLAVDKRQEVMREEAAKALQITDTGKMLYIGELDPDIINAAISADRELISKNDNEVGKIHMKDSITDVYSL
jgi:peptide subunit release factor RF-3